MCRCEMLDVDNSHLLKEKVTGSFGSAKGSEGGRWWTEAGEVERERGESWRKNREGGKEDEERGIEGKASKHPNSTVGSGGSPP